MHSNLGNWERVRRGVDDCSLGWFNENVNIPPTVHGTEGTACFYPGVPAEFVGGTTVASYLDLSTKFAHVVRCYSGEE